MQIQQGAPANAVQPQIALPTRTLSRYLVATALLNLKRTDWHTFDYLMGKKAKEAGTSTIEFTLKSNGTGEIVH